MKKVKIMLAKNSNLRLPSNMLSRQNGPHAESLCVQLPFGELPPLHPQAEIYYGHFWHRRSRRPLRRPIEIIRIQRIIK